MPRVADLTDSAVSFLTTVVPVGEGVCEVCHGAPRTGFLRCWSCARTCSQVSGPILIVVPLALYQLEGQLHHVLSRYKDGYTAQVRESLSLLVAALLTRFLGEHGRCIEATTGFTWSRITTVPSSGTRPQPHPLDAAIQQSPTLRNQFAVELSRGTGELARNCASDGAFSALRDLRGQSILLLDDTLTSGARLQSAASSLASAGARVVAAVVVGRVIHPEFSPEADALWTRASGQPFDFSRCCLCATR